MDGACPPHSWLGVTLQPSLSVMRRRSLAVSSGSPNAVLGGWQGVRRLPPNTPLSHVEFPGESLALSHLLPSDLQTGNAGGLAWQRRVGFGDRAVESPALLSDTGQVTQSFSSLICTRG